MLPIPLRITRIHNNTVLISIFTSSQYWFLVPIRLSGADLSLSSKKTGTETPETALRSSESPSTLSNSGLSQIKPNAEREKGGEIFARR